MDMLRYIPRILKAIKTGQIQYTLHAYEQMQRRQLTEMDLINIGTTCVDARWQADKQTYLVVGYATNGKGAAVSCKIV